MNSNNIPEVPSVPNEPDELLCSISIEMENGKIVIKMNRLPMFPQPIEDEVDCLISELTELDRLRKVFKDENI